MRPSPAEKFSKKVRYRRGRGCCQERRTTRTFSAPRKWMRGKGRQTNQFGCFYNYATDKNGNPPGILKSEMVDPLPPLFKSIIKGLVRWRVLPPSSLPDSCIVRRRRLHPSPYQQPRLFQVVLHDIVPQSVLVLNGNGADVAKHCVPAVPTKRTSITFRRMT
ncbi:RNA demethylase ALKBH9B-like protein [Drosera capensis]